MVQTLSSCFDSYVDTLPDTLALRCPNERGEMQQLSRRELGTMVVSYAVGLYGLGVRSGDRVVLAIDTSVEFVVAFWATIRLGAVAIPSAAAAKYFKMPQRTEMLKSICAIARPRIVLASTSIAESCVKIDTIPVKSAAAVWSEIRGEDPRMLCGEDDCAVLQFTSGTIAAPKGCVLTHGAILTNARAIIGRVDVRPLDAAVIWLPLFHDMGLMTGIIAPVVAGAAMSLRPPTWFLVNPMSWLAECGRFDRVHTAVPNFALALLLERVRRRRPADLWLGSVVTFVCGSEPIDPRLVRDFLAAVTPSGFQRQAFHAGYGMAEATLMVTSRPGGLATHLVSKAAMQRENIAVDGVTTGPSAEIVNVGRPIEGVRVRVVDSSGQIVSDCCLGEVEVDSPSLMRGYFENEIETKKVFRDRWLRTGDIGYLRDGELFITGRARDIIIVAGSNIIPSELENAIARDAAIEPLRIAVFGCAGRMGTDEIHVVIEMKSSARWQALEQRVAQSCFDACGVIPSSVVPVPLGTIPRTTSGKVRRSELRAILPTVLTRAQTTDRTLLLD